MITNSHNHDNCLADLTPREREVLELMAEGLANRGIAERLLVTEAAVEKHITNIFYKMGLPPGPILINRRVKVVLEFLENPHIRDRVKAEVERIRVDFELALRLLKAYPKNWTDRLELIDRLTNQLMNFDGKEDWVPLLKLLEGQIRTLAGSVENLPPAVSSDDDHAVPLIPRVLITSTKS